MKIKIDKEKITNIFKENVKYLPTVVIGLILISFSILTFRALRNRVDNEQVLRGQERVRSLDIRFNTKLLGELGTTKTPTELGTSGGRDPFAGF